MIKPDWYEGRAVARSSAMTLSGVGEAFTRCHYLQSNL